MFGQNKDPFANELDTEPLFVTSDPRDPLNSFARSPWLTMAAAGLQNMGQMRQGAAPSTNPIAAYQQAVSQQSLANQQHRQNVLAQKKGQQGLEIGEQTMELNRQKLNPFYEYEEAKKRGIIDPSMSYAEFLNMSNKGFDSTSAIKNYAQRQALVEAVDNAPDEASRKEAEAELAAFDTYVRAPQMYAGGGGSQYRVGVGGAPEELVGAGVATERDAAREGAKTTATEGAKTREQQVRAGIDGARDARAAYQTAESVLKTTNEYLAKFEGQDTVDTGFIPAMMFRTFGIGDEALGELNADTIHMALKNLGITNLAPVTEQEFASVMQMWADISKSPEANKGALTAALRRTERLMDRVRDDAIYNAGLVQEYGSEQQYGAFTRSNPFVQELLDDPEIP